MTICVRSFSEARFFVVSTCSLIYMRAAKIYFYNSLVHSMFHAIDHSEFVEALLYVGFTYDLFCTVLNSMKMTVPFRGN